MRKKIILMLVLVLAFTMFATGCKKEDPAPPENNQPAADTSLTDLQARGEMILGCDDQFPPMGFLDENDEITGFDIELAELVAEKLGVKLTAKVIDWGTKETELKNGKIDVIWNGYTMNKKRNEAVEYTKPYLNNQQVIVVKNDSTIAKKADLTDKNIGAQVESSGLDAINGDAELLGNLKTLKEYDNYMMALMDLNTSRLDAVIIDKIVINYVMAKDGGKYKVLEESLGDELYGIGCPKGAVALREAIDTALDELQEDGSIDKLCEKWFGKNIVVRDIPKLTDKDFE